MILGLSFFGLLTLLSLPDVEDEFFYVGVLLVGGLVVTNSDERAEHLGFVQNGAGAIISPFDCYLLLRGIKTLGVRMDRHCENAQRIAEFLEGQDIVDRVLYPGLASHPQHELAIAEKLVEL